MKKTYISPAMDVTLYVAEQMLANSITNIGGDSGIKLADPTDPTQGTPGEGDVKANPFGESIFD